MLHIIVFLQFLFACSTPLNKFLLGLTAPLILMSLRLTIAGLVIFIGYYWWKRPSLQLTREAIKIFIQKILIGSYLKYLLKYWALQYMLAIKMAFLLYATPFCAALTSYALRKEKLSMPQIIGLLCGLAGILPLILAHNNSEEIFYQFKIISLPEIALIGAVFAHCFSLHCTQQLVRIHKIPAPLVSSIASFGAGLLALITALYFQVPFTIEQPSVFFSWFFILILVSNIIAHTWYISLLKNHSATFLALTDYLNPIFVALYSWLFLGEEITWHYIVSAFIIFSGLYLFKRKS